MLNGLDLFSGIGGLTVALEPWVRPVAYCENDRYAQSVLLSRMSNGSIIGAPIWDDVRTLRGSGIGIGIDIITGGFPCQDISVAGRRVGLGGERSRLFLHVARLAEEVRPAFIFLENVPAIRSRGLSVVIFELARLGFDLRWTIVSAAEVGAPHLRKRWFCLAAHPDRIKDWVQPRGGRGRIGKRRYALPQLALRGELPNHPKGLLNPAWTEQAMGYPIEWTAIEDWAMPWFRPKREKPSKGLLALKEAGDG